MHTTANETVTDLVFPAERLSRLQTLALIMGVVGLVLFVVGIFLYPGRFWHSALYAYLFWFGVSAGSLGLLMLHHMVSGGWGFLLRRQFEAAAKMLPLMAVFFALITIPGLHALFEWTHADSPHHGIIEKKAAYLNVPFFYIRAVIYFLIWFFFASRLIRLGNTQDERSDLGVMNRLNLTGAWGLVVMVLTMTFAMVDWVMSLTPEWFSSIIGLLFSATHALSALALMLALFWYLNGGLPRLAAIPTKYYRDLGNLLLALVMLWAYLSFSQLLIIYSANIAEETLWYQNRQRGGWGIISLSLIPLHFALPFLVLLVGSGLKRNPKRLAGVALFIVLMRHLDLFWWVAPTFRANLFFTPSDFGATMLIGGVWLWFWAEQLKGRRILPVYDPRLEGHWPLQPAHEAAHH